MNFELTEQQKAIQEAARKFAQEELLPGVLERDEKRSAQQIFARKDGKYRETVFDSQVFFRITTVRAGCI